MLKVEGIGPVWGKTDVAEQVTGFVFGGDEGARQPHSGRIGDRA